MAWRNGLHCPYRPRFGVEPGAATALHYKDCNTMLVAEHTTIITDQARYAGCIEVSQRVRWDIDRDVVLGRRLDFGKRFLPEGLTRSGGRSNPTALSQALPNSGVNHRPPSAKYARPATMGDNTLIESLLGESDRGLRQLADALDDAAAWQRAAPRQRL
jgi:hypothetical protein